MQDSESGEKGELAGLLKRKLPQAGCPHLLKRESGRVIWAISKFGRNGDLALVKIRWCSSQRGRCARAPAPEPLHVCRSRLAECLVTKAQTESP